MVALALLAHLTYHGATFKVDVKAWVDGRDKLSLSGKSLHWAHEDYGLPGLTTVTVRRGRHVQQMLWTPVWPHGTGQGATSAAFNGLPRSLSNATLVDFKVIHSRETAAIAQLPMPSNGFETVVTFDDDGIFGADSYEVELTYKHLSKRKLRALFHS
ncbi:MAG TPA: hypothetical protein VGL56_18540 [Fimbriimonadaceae bacterium]|jgi:hypothetical protein